MYSGKITEELQELLDKYEKKYGYDANSEEDAQYSDVTYNEYIEALKRCIDEDVEIFDI